MKETLEIKAVEMTRRIRDAHAEQLRGATHEERMAFFNQAARKRKEAHEPGDVSEAPQSV
ncbi:MAG: hypothetical protein IAE99_00700 [Rhodothermales bacterium]|nr:hypothetical protein [Rhodothermales bacterium]MCA0268515.1 hypothetical protein [Bacteroidota bacterium]